MSLVRIDELEQSGGECELLVQDLSHISDEDLEAGYPEGTGRLSAACDIPLQSENPARLQV